MDPHTTTKEGRGCLDCHANPRSLGLGAGSLTVQEGRWIFQPALVSEPGRFGHEQPLDRFVAPDGTPLVHTSRPWLRPLNGTEILRILNAGPCLQCHTTMDDPVIASWRPGSPPDPCRYSPFSSWPKEVITRDDTAPATAKQPSD